MNSSAQESAPSTSPGCSSAIRWLAAVLLLGFAAAQLALGCLGCSPVCCNQAQEEKSAIDSPLVPAVFASSASYATGLSPLIPGRMRAGGENVRVVSGWRWGGPGSLRAGSCTVLGSAGSDSSRSVGWRPLLSRQYHRASLALRSLAADAGPLRWPASAPSGPATAHCVGSAAAR